MADELDRAWAGLHIFCGVPYPDGDKAPELKQDHREPWYDRRDQHEPDELFVPDEVLVQSDAHDHSIKGRWHGRR